MSVAGGGDGEVDCSLARPPPPLHAHPPPTIGLDEDVMGVGGCDVERVSPSQVTAVSSDTHSSSPDTQTACVRTHVASHTIHSWVVWV
ncbi:hypothetical protein Pcinc_033337 [Petrolisthes cinctipes]|uniref:Uncharacterized protein n=1 Tax=Petrolisthes cinctipes TaxID=88211 RepID=A0AAE1ESB9_PETCI|nr:hypothetical protein Pcinc_033337 [Petrolisthes cinctipes]